MNTNSKQINVLTKGTPIHVDCVDGNIDGTLAQDYECLDGIVRIIEDETGIIFHVPGWCFNHEIEANNALYLYD